MSLASLSGGSRTQAAAPRISPEVLNLAALAGRKEEGARRALFEQVVTLADTGGDGLNTTEAALVDEILTGLVSYMDKGLRKDLADRFAARADAPEGLIRWLAGDEIEIAEPVLRASPLLDDDSLIEIVETKSPDHRLAVAERPGLTASVCGALVARNEPGVILALLDNDSAQIPQSVFEELIERAKGVPPLQRPLIARKDLSPVLAHRLFWAVSQGLRAQILDRFSVPEAEVDRVLSDALADGLARLVPEAEAAIAVVTPGEKGAARSIAEFLGQLRGGEDAALARSLAALLRVREETARKLLSDKGGEALAVACKALEADRSQFTTICLLMDYKRFGQARPTGHLSALSQIYDRIPAPRARATVRLWNSERG